MQPDSTSYAIEHKVAEHLSASRWTGLPAPSRESAVRAILWWLATGLEGTVEASHSTLLRYVEAQGGKAEATILGTARKTTAELAGLINGRAGKAWEHEDKYWVDTDEAWADLGLPKVAPPVFGE